MSPDGKSIVFASDMTGTTNLWIINSDGTSLRRLTSGLELDDAPSWSPDGNTIAFTRIQNRVKSVWTIHRDGSSARRLIFQTSANFQPAWSPRNNQISFVSEGHIWIANTDGTSPTQVTQLDGEESEPSFSPSGAEIVFCERLRGSSSLFVVTLASGVTRNITSVGFDDLHPSWSSSGIIFSSDRLPRTVSGNNTIWIVKGDGSDLRELSGVATLDPTWTPNGDILFTDELNAGVGSEAGISLLKLSSAARVAIPLLPPSFNGDLNEDGFIDLKDLAVILWSLNTAANSEYDPRDRNGDGHIGVSDLQALSKLCSYSLCSCTRPD